MLLESCFSDDDCEFMQFCDGGICGHNSIFPLSVYTILIYLFMGIAAALVNVCGSCMGLFKMLLLVIALNYDLTTSTALSQAMVVGSALPNFINIILKRHPNGKTSLVNYRLLEVIIPCCLLGSTMGVIIQEFLPNIAQLAILVVVFTYFAWNFWLKLNLVRKKQLKNQQQIVQSLISEGDFLYQSQIQAYNPMINQSLPLQYSGKVHMELVNYENSLHVRDILRSIVLFIIFQFISFLLQGDMSFYSFGECNFLFWMGIVILTTLTFAYVYYLRIRFKKLFAQYRLYKIQQEMELDNDRVFLFMVAGSLFGGCIQSILGVGCGTCIVLVLLMFSVNTSAASATSAYQILFTGGASLLEFYLNKQIKTMEMLWFLGVNLVLGGIATISLTHILHKFNQITVSKVLISIIMGLCIMSVLLVIPSVFRILQADGWDGMTSIKFHC